MNPKKNDVREHFTRHEERAEKTNSVQPRVRFQYKYVQKDPVPKKSQANKDREMKAEEGFF